MFKKDGDCALRANVDHIEGWQTHQLYPVDAAAGVYGTKCDNNKFITVEFGWIHGREESIGEREEFIITLFENVFI